VQQARWSLTFSRRELEKNFTSSLVRPAREDGSAT
jgi:hypothetical protein